MGDMSVSFIRGLFTAFSVCRLVRLRYQYLNSSILYFVIAYVGFTIQSVLLESCARDSHFPGTINYTYLRNNDTFITFTDVYKKNKCGI